MFFTECQAIDTTRIITYSDSLHRETLLTNPIISVDNSHNTGMTSGIETCDKWNLIDSSVFIMIWNIQTWIIHVFFNIGAWRTVSWLKPYPANF